MKLSDLGEREIIRHLNRFANNEMPEDCALIESGRHYIMISSDSVSVENNIPEGAPDELIGEFLAGINLSDIAAMGGIPIGMVIDVLAPPDTEMESLEGIYMGASRRLSQFGSYIMGGDTKEAKELILAGTIFGRQLKNKVIRRSGIAAGQIIGITGKLGKCVTGYHLYRSGYRINHAIRLMLDFVPRVREGQILADSGVKFMTDLSDGLFSSIWQIKESFGLGARIVGDDIPVYSGIKKAADITDIDTVIEACNFGGDYELMFTVNNEDYEGFREQMKKSGVEVHFIGDLYHGDPILFREDRWHKIEKKGYEHFTKNRYV